MQRRNLSASTLDNLGEIVSKALGRVQDIAKNISDVQNRIGKLNIKLNQVGGIDKAAINRQLVLQKRLLANLITQKANANNDYNGYLRLYNAKKNAHNQFLERKNSRSVAEIINDHRANGEAGYTAIYRSDLKDNTVFFLSEQSPSEQSSFNVPTHPVDSDDPRTNYVSESSRQLSGTYWLFGDSLDDCNQQYEKLLNLAKSGVKFAIDGFSKWGTANIASLQKQIGENAGNALQLSIQFNYAKDAHIQTARDITPKPPAPPVPPPPPPVPAPPGVWVRVNKGDTYWRAMTIYGTSIAQLEAWNPWEAHVIPIGVMMRVK